MMAENLGASGQASLQVFETKSNLCRIMRFQNRQVDYKVCLQHRSSDTQRKAVELDFFIRPPVKITQLYTILFFQVRIAHPPVSRHSPRVYILVFSRRLGNGNIAAAVLLEQLDHLFDYHRRGNHPELGIGQSFVPHHQVGLQQHLLFRGQLFKPIAHLYGPADICPLIGKLNQAHLCQLHRQAASFSKILRNVLIP